MKKIPANLTFWLLNLAIALFLVCGIAIYVLHWLDNYTQHGQSIAVPEFYNLTQEEAESLATYNHLRIQVIDSIYDEHSKPGTVAEQYPGSGARIKENRLIHLTMNARNPEKVALPNLQNAAYRQTLQTLVSKGFTIGQISYIPSEFKNLVLGLQAGGEDLQAGSLLRKGATIDIILGDGNSSNLVYIPFLLGKSLQEATDIARKAYLNIGEIIPDGSIDSRTDKNTAIVYEQNPIPNSQIEAGSTINFYITHNQEKIAALDTLGVNP